VESTTTQLRRRTDGILAAPPVRISADEAERDRLAVAECRYLLRLLATRRRSEGEMRARLAEREVAPEVAEEALARTGRAGLIDDGAFSRAWVAQRRERKGLADEALRLELEAKGVAAELIDEALDAEASCGDPAHAEEERCRELARGRLARDAGRLRAGDADERARVARRVDGYLRRRGYAGDLVTRVVSGEMLALTGR
jgi:regulatory protein